MIERPSPASRSITTPGMRWSDSARLVSGNLPMSSALITSTIPVSSRLARSAASSEARNPVTTIWSAGASSAAASAGSSCASAMPGAASAVPMNSAILASDGFERTWRIPTPLSALRRDCATGVMKRCAVTRSCLTGTSLPKPCPASSSRPAALMPVLVTGVICYCRARAALSRTRIGRDDDGSHSSPGWSFSGAVQWVG